jgi:cob(I)alamin adenosyltransferase
VEACGAVDELNAALGVARAAATQPFVRDHLESIQQDLIGLMGELATELQDLPRYATDGYAAVNSAMTARLETLVKEIESREIPFHGWATPGSSLPCAMLELARATCRRAERRVCALREAGQLANPEVLVYLNRLSDTLWLLARWSEK